jgi:formylglycine-generating enzyme required for sulfatase activity
LTWAQQRKGRLDHPVVNVSWHDVVAYTQWLAEQTGQPWRLPSEAEWEKAARGTDGRLYPWGDAFDANRCNTSEGNKGTTTPVDSFPDGASPYGALDMAGNVWEWTSTIFKPYPYSATDGRERAESPENRVQRGGSWGYVARYARAACRSSDNPPDFVLGTYGFRVVCALQ